MTEFAITNATVVLPDEVIEAGTVVVRDGLINDVQAAYASPTPDGHEVIDARGAVLMPGLIDLHNDALEFEVNPRPRVNLPIPFALNNLECRLLAAGVTTEFHAISFLERPNAQRTVSNARERSAFIAALEANGSPRGIDHFVQHRINVRDRDALDVVFSSLDSHAVRFASLNDHTPGQGQYRDVKAFSEQVKRTQTSRGESWGTADLDEIQQRIADAAADIETVPYIYDQVRTYSRLTPIVIATHDDHTPEKLDAQWEIGATMAEFPITFETAERAREREMTIVVGAPNIVRGGSQSGNLPAHELVERDLADIICADYHAPSLLASVLKLVDSRLRTLDQAVRMVTLNAAEAVGLHDRGAIRPGMRADLTLMRRDEYGFPVVEGVFTRGRQSFAYERGAGARLNAVHAGEAVGAGANDDDD